MIAYMFLILVALFHKFDFIFLPCFLYHCLLKRTTRFFVYVYVYVYCMVLYVCNCLHVNMFYHVLIINALFFSLLKYQ